MWRIEWALRSFNPCVSGVVFIISGDRDLTPLQLCCKRRKSCHGGRKMCRIEWALRSFNPTHLENTKEASETSFFPTYRNSPSNEGLFL
jgi:hypothetical protein